MKKLNAIILAAVMLASITGCNADTESKEQNNSTSQSEGKNDNTSKTDSSSETENKSDDNSQTDEKKTDATPKEIEAAVAKALGDGYICDTPITESFMIPFDTSLAESYVAKQNSLSSVNLDTIFVVKAKDGCADDIVNSINESYAQTISYIRQYPFGVAKVEGARLYKNGNMVIFVIAGDPGTAETTEEEAAKLATSEYEKIDNVLKDYFDLTNLAVIPKEDNFSNGGGALPPEDYFIPDDNGGIMIGG